MAIDTEKLRKHPAFYRNGALWVMASLPEPICVEAADEIDRLHRINQNLQWQIDYMCSGIAQILKLEADTPADALQSVSSLMGYAMILKEWEDEFQRGRKEGE